MIDRVRSQGWARWDSPPNRSGKWIPTYLLPKWYWPILDIWRDQIAGEKIGTEELEVLAATIDRTGKVLRKVNIRAADLMVCIGAVGEESQVI
jgi:hypothetical protein